MSLDTTSAPSLWEEGREPGREVVALGLALGLSVVALDVLLVERLSLFFDLCFVALCLLVALRVRPGDFFMVGVLPPLLMLAVVALLATVRPEAVARADDGLLQAVVSGLAHHAAALAAGYAVCLLTLAHRQRVLARR